VLPECFIQPGLDQLVEGTLFDNRPFSAKTPLDACAKMIGRQQGLQVHRAAFVFLQGGFEPQHVDPANHLVHRPEAKLRHVLPEFGRHKTEEGHDVVGFTVELAAQARILGGDSERTRVQVAFAHHHAPQRDEQRGPESIFLSPEQCGDGQVPAGFQVSVDLQDYVMTQIVDDQGLLGLSQSQLPRQSHMPDGGQRSRPGSSILPTDQDPVGFCLGHSRGNSSHSRFRYEFHRDRSARIHLPDVMDQLGEILDGIDVVMRWRTDQRHVRDCVPDLGDVIGDF